MRTILIVEDEYKIRQVLNSYLVHAGYRVEEVENGLMALSILEQTAIDLVLLDLMLPDITGEELCKQIRSISPVPKALAG